MREVREDTFSISLSLPSFNNQLETLSVCKFKGDKKTKMNIALYCAEDKEGFLYFSRIFFGEK